MTPDQIVERTQAGQLEKDWIVFHYRPGREALFLFFKLLYLLGFGGGAFVLLVWGYLPSRSNEFLYSGLLLGFCALFALGFFLRGATRLIYTKKNVIVITSSGIIKSLSGKVNEYLYTDIQNLRLVRTQGRSAGTSTMPQYYIEFTYAPTRKIIELARNSMFGRADDIYTVLQTKIQ